MLTDSQQAAARAASKRFIASYHHEGSDWSIHFYAVDFADRAIASIQLDLDYYYPARAKPTDSAP